MDVSKYKLAGMQDALKKTLGAPVGKSIVAEIHKTTKAALENLVDNGVLNSSEVKGVQTLHEGKKIFGRVKDFFLWKTFLKRWHYKPFYMQVDLSDSLRKLHEYSGVFEGLEDEEVERLLDSVSGIHVWEELYPDDPYSIVIVDVVIQPVIPVEQISVSITMENE